MRFIYQICIILFCAVTLSAQEFSVHKFHLNEFGSKEKSLPKAENLSAQIIPLQIKAKPEKVIFGYLPDWEYNKGSYQYFNYDLLTHIAAFDFMVSANGNVSYPSGWPWTDVINEAHSNGVKVIMTAVTFEGDDIHNIITNETAKTNFFNKTKSILQSYKLDGVNIDFESLNNADKSSNINNFMKELTEFIHTELPGKEVSFAGPAIDWGSNWNLKGLSENCDYIFIMEYSFWGSWSSTTGPQAPLTNTGQLISVSRSLANEYAQIINSTPGKLILGMPYYGNKWKVIGSSETSTVDEYIKSVFYSEAVNVYSQKGKNWSTKYKVPWIGWNEGDWYQMWCDDDSSLGLKIDLALSKNLLGVGMWALGYDGASTDLWNLLARKIAPDVEQIPSTPNNFAVTIENANSLNILFSESSGQTGYRILGSNDGVNFTDTTFSITNNVTIKGAGISNPGYFKVEAFNSAYTSGQTEVLGAVAFTSATKALIVNGFDRSSANTRDYINKYISSMDFWGEAIESASNEAVYNGFVDLKDYEAVFWILGDESTADDTFNGTEQEIIIEYLENGGHLCVSGSEAGWDLGRTSSSSLEDLAFYKNYLKAEYIDDAPAGKNGEYYKIDGIDNTIMAGLSNIDFDNGTHGTYDVDWPDAIKPVGGAEGILKFNGVDVSQGYAGISYEGEFGNGYGKLVYLTVPIETIYNEETLQEIFYRLMDFMITMVSVDDEQISELPNEFKLKQNYPNPFNPSTVIEYNIPELKTGYGLSVQLKVFDILGNEIATLVKENQLSGNYKINWNAGQLASGVYIYQLRAGSFFESKKMILQK
ncbi:MAG: T9SS type A sorting domain-containing protein [Melioribacteraceae bacterium]|nr:T9SS type A sorting domain-containing protein [Melioribacteraceae bacterium]